MEKIEDLTPRTPCGGLPDTGRGAWLRMDRPKTRPAGSQARLLAVLIEPAGRWVCGFAPPHFPIPTLRSGTASRSPFSAQRQAVVFADTKMERGWN